MKTLKKYLFDFEKPIKRRGAVLLNKKSPRTTEVGSRGRVNPSSTYFQMLPELKIVLGYELEPGLAILYTATACVRHSR